MTARDAGTLRRVLGVGFGLAAVVGGVVGQGILRAPGIVAGAAPDPTLILLLWFAGGLLAAASAFALVELGASIPRAGGPYAFATRVFGPAAGAAVGWTDWLNSVLVVSYVSVVFAEFVHRLGLLGSWPEGAVAVLLIATVTTINWIGTRTSGASQEIGSALKGIGLLLLVVVLFAGGTATGSAPAPSAEGTGSPPGVALTLASIVVAMRVIQNTYSGWNGPVYFGEEIRDAGHALARAVFGGIAFVTLAYVLVNAALLHVLTPHEMAASTLPAADAVQRVLGARAELVVNVLSVVSVAALANLYAMSLSRIGFAMARDGAMPAPLSRVATSGTPRTALLAAMVTATAFTTLGGYERIVDVAVPLGVLCDALMCAAAIRLRLREPDLPRPFRMPLFPLPALFGLALNLALLAGVIWENPRDSVIGLAALTLVGAAYAVRAVARR